MQLEEVIAGFREIKEAIKSRKKSTSLLFGEHNSVFKGAGFEITGVSEWRTGEPVGDISWRLSLRTFPDKVYKVERMEPRQTRTLIVNDLSYSTLFSIENNEHKALLMLELIGSIGMTHAHYQDPVGLLGFSDQIETYLKPKLGSGHIYYIAKVIFEKLKYEQEFHQRHGTDFALMTKFLTERLKMRHKVFIISDFIDILNSEQEFDAVLLKKLGAKHDIVFIILDDEEEFKMSGGSGYIRMSNMETGESVNVPIRKTAAIRQEIQERQKAFSEMLKREANIDSIALSYGNHYLKLAQFFAQRGGH